MISESRLFIHFYGNILIIVQNRHSLVRRVCRCNMWALFVSKKNIFLNTLTVSVGFEGSSKERTQFPRLINFNHDQSAEKPSSLMGRFRKPFGVSSILLPAKSSITEHATPFPYCLVVEDFIMIIMLGYL